MASYKRFEDTPAWRLAQDYAYAIFEVTREDCFKYRGDLVNQLRRAALSISNNIAEGFSRGTTNDFINFLIRRRERSSGGVRTTPPVPVRRAISQKLQEIDVAIAN